MKNIATALVKAQSEMSNPKKGNTNPFFKSKYADLNAVREAVIPILNENGISVLQPLIHKDGKNFVNTILLHESGELMESYTEIIYNKVNDAQAQGSGITYARRYGLQSFVCVGADDDDGNKASQPPQSKEVKIDISRLETRLTACTTIDELGKVYMSFTASEKQATEVLKNELKEKLTPIK
jgi:hypothetical protein